MKSKNNIVPNVRIAGVVSTVPSILKKNNDIFGPIEQIQRIAHLSGVQQRYIADKYTCTSDLCFLAVRRLLAELKWSADSIDAMIFLSQTSDHLIPSTSCILQDRLKLRNDCIVFDMNIGCSGYVYGLFVASKLLNASTITRVLLLAGDTVSKVISPEDCACNVLCGDAGSATALEFSKMNNEFHFLFGSDGSYADSLIIKDGHFRKNNGVNAVKSFCQDKLYMDGANIFKLALTYVPNTVKRLFANANLDIDEIDFWLIHQANKFIVDSIANKIGILGYKVLSNIEKFGNTSSASIPLLFNSEREIIMEQQVAKVCLISFGSGFSWGCAIVNLDFPVFPNVILFKE